MKIVILSLVAMALACGPALAQKPMTFEECVKELAAHNPDLYVAQEAVNVARANMLSSYSPFLPQVSAGGSANRNNQELDTGYEATTAYSASIAANQNIFNGFQDIAALNQSRAKMTQADINLQRIKANLSAEIRDAFIELMFAQDAFILDGKIAGRRKDNLALIEMRFEAGNEDRGSLLRSQAFYNQALLDVSETKRRIRVAQCKLNKVLGRYENLAVTVTGTWERAQPPPPPDFQELVKTTPEYRKANVQCAIAREQIRIARSGYLPTWSVSANFGLSDDESIIPRNESWSVGTSVGLNVFNGGQTIFAVRAAHAQLRGTEAQLASTANTTLSAMEEAFTSWQNAVDRVRLQSQLLEAAEIRMEIAQIKYSNGLMSFQDWDTIGNELISNQQNMLEREKLAIAAQAQWEKVVGISVVP